MHKILDENKYKFDIIYIYNLKLKPLMLMFSEITWPIVLIFYFNERLYHGGGSYHNSICLNPPKKYLIQMSKI